MYSIFMKKYLELEYPYNKYIYKIDIKKIKNLVKNFKPVIYNIIPNEIHYKLKKYNNEYVIIIDKWDTNYELNKITDNFTEEERVKCEFKNNKSPIKYWNQNKENIIDELIKSNIKIDIFNIREHIHTKIKLCNNFRISVSLAILQKFKVRKWLDMSAGWGDRLLSAIFHNVKLYYGIDPNKDLHKHYKKMIETFVPEKKRHRYFLIEDGFETCTLPNIKFDTVFTSPPFFDLETYSNYENDSITKYNSEKSWCDNFLIPSLKKANKYLKKDGHLILYFDTRSNYVKQELYNFNKIMYFEGIIYFNDTSPRSIYVWKKI